MKDLVQMIDGKAVTTSRKVAEVFEKQHKHVLEAIRNLEIPETYRKPNFRLTVYEQPNPSGGKPIQQPVYLITRDGFTLLAMGFTGKRAMEFKIAYIEAFNEMEKALTDIGCTTAIPSLRPANIAVSTTQLIDKINWQLISGKEVEPEILRYAWNIGRLVGHRKRIAMVGCDDEYINRFMDTVPRGEQLSKNEVYGSYCDFCRSENCTPCSPRSFWPRANKCANLRTVRTSNARYIIVEL